MDASMSGYLRRIDGLDAQIWAEPSRGHRFWLRHAPALFAPSLDDPRPLVRWWAIATVAPGTNVTGLNRRYQSYLDAIFHRTRLARAGHAVCMPIIVAAMLAALCPLRMGASAIPLPGGTSVSLNILPLNASLPAAVGLAVWWVWWAVKERDTWWAVGNAVLVVVLWSVANAAYHVRPHATGGAALAWAPVAWVLVGSLLQAGSHVLEPLPPRVSRSPYWVPVGEYLLGRPERRNRPGTVVRRAGHVAAQALFGTVDELVASPRLLPVLLLRLLWAAGHDPAGRASCAALAARAIASGNPALDYVGTGGSTPLRFASPSVPPSAVPAESVPSRSVPAG
jgi:hypothetical protein